MFPLNINGRRVASYQRPLSAKSGRYDSAVIKPPTPKDLLKWGQQNRYITHVVTLYHQDAVDCVF